MGGFRQRRLLIKLGNDIKTIKSLHKSRILITGASGWIGRETLCLLQREVGPLCEMNLTLTGSVDKRIDIHGQSISIFGPREAVKADAFDFIFHFAFITQEKVLSMGKNEYTRANVEINETAQEIALCNPEAKQLVLSSGATKLLLENSLNSESKGLYAKLKLDLEEKTTDSRTLILRLWNTSGHHLGINPNYAISEFIHSAKNNKDIEIGNNLKRSYVYSQDVIRASILYLCGGGSGVNNSGGAFTDLKSLASRAVQINNSTSKIRVEVKPQHSGFDYVSPPSDIPKEFWLQEINLEQQIIDTSAGIDV